MSGLRPSQGLKTDLLRAQASTDLAGRLAMNLDHLKSYLRFCHSCSRFFESIDLLCSDCWAQLQSEIGSEWICDNLDFPCRYLWLWQGKKPLLQSVIYGLKGGGLRSASSRLASEMLWSWQDRIPREPWTLVPLPPSQPTPTDHAKELAMALAHKLQWPIDLGLSRITKGKQRQKNIKHRQDISLNYRGGSRPKRVILVDDVVTTGATAREALKALGHPPLKQLWVLSYRAPEAKGKSKNEKIPIFPGP